MVVVNVVINIRNGQRLSIDDYGWLMNGVIVGTLSVAPTAAMGFAGYRFARGRWGWAIFATLVAIPLVGWSSWRSTSSASARGRASKQLTVQLNSMNSILNSRLNSAWKTLAATSFGSGQPASSTR